MMAEGCSMKADGLSRRRFLSMGLRSLAACALATVLAPLRRAMAGTAVRPRFFRRIVTGDNRGAAMIEWQSDGPLVSPYFSRREHGAREERGAEITETRLEIDGHVTYVGRAKLTGLKPGRTYDCLLETGDGVKESFSFTTEDGGPFRALIFPDSQCEGDYDVWGRVASEAVRRFPDADLWVNMGDLTDNGSSFYQWEEWLSNVDGLMGSRAFAPVMGNHECYSSEWTHALPAAFLGLFAVPSAGSAKYDRYYYSFDYGPVHFTVLNTQQAELEEAVPGLFREQADWLVRDLARTKKNWRVVLMHRDLIDYDEEPPRPDPFVETLVPLIEAGGADAVLTAHAHGYRRRRLRGWKHDRQGVMYILTGNAGNCFYQVGRHALDEVALPDNCVNYLTMEATDDHLTFCCYLPNGIRKDFTTIRKRPPASSEEE